MKRCTSETFVRDSVHQNYRCVAAIGHTGVHRNRHLSWTDDMLVWDYEIDDFRAIV